MENVPDFSDRKKMLLQMGISMILISLASFGYFEWLITSNLMHSEDSFVCFFISYGCFFIFLFGLLLTRMEEQTKSVKFSQLDFNILLLILGNISAYALNRILPVFHESTPWLIAYLIILNGAMLIFVFRKKKTPDVFNHLLVAILASGVLFNIYQAVYIFPFYGITAMSFWFFGISLHTLIPVWYIFTMVKILKKYRATSDLYQYGIITGICIPALLTMVFAFQFYQVNESFRKAYAAEQSPFSNPDFPAWVNASKHISSGWITERVLKSGIYYSVLDDQHFRFGLNGLNMNGIRTKHDPMVVVGAFVSGQLNIDRNERIRLLKTMYNERHAVAPRLWRGDDLTTTNIETNVQIFPDYRLAYTEKNITIKNENKSRWWGRQQEAIYSFYLPEGSVVTSASLWIEGEEQKALLTTRAKADSAYQTIVGRERRDPLLLHWQEGNRISVRIFPCTREADRKFKIGITSPLTYEKGQLTYHNIDFAGPDWTGANEVIRVKTETALTEFSAPRGFSDEGDHWMYDGQYHSEWAINFTAPKLNNSAFNFTDQSVRMQEYEEKLKSFQPTKVYLDIHNGWNKSTINQILTATKNQEVYVFTNTLQRITSDNKKRLIKHLLNNNYSLFPFYELPDREDVLVISHHGRLTPAMDDLKGTSFYKKSASHLPNRQFPPSVFHLGEAPSPYLKTLRELRLLDYWEGTKNTLLDHLEKETFPVNGEGENYVLLRPANVQLVKSGNKSSTTTTTTAAPDHLWRMYAYNNVMRKMGKDYFRKDQDQQRHIAEAEAAYVVTPISSLVTLETQKDYDRFNIKNSNRSLGNASIVTGGAVPEPYEWMLIILGLMVAGWLFFFKSRI